MTVHKNAGARVAKGPVSWDTKAVASSEAISTLTGLMEEAFKLEETIRSGDDLDDAVIEAKGLKQMSDTGELERILDEVLAANAKSVEEFRAGKEKAFNALVGQAMKATKGKANPAAVNELLKKKLAGG